jgi:hypothetical protein
VPPRNRVEKTSASKTNKHMERCQWNSASPRNLAAAKVPAARAEYYRWMNSWARAGDVRAVMAHFRILFVILTRERKVRTTAEVFFQERTRPQMKMGTRNASPHRGKRRMAAQRRHGLIKLLPSPPAVVAVVRRIGIRAVGVGIISVRRWIWTHQARARRWF